MKLRFSKMQGLGNDFVVLDGVSTSITLTPVQIRHLADRHFGVGCDQILLVERARSPETADFRYRIFNADGGEVEHCGNGSRCFVHFVRDQGLTDKRTIRVETAKGLLELRLHDDGLVTVDMGEPCFVPVEIPFVAEAEAVTYPLAVGDHSVQIGAVSMGNPHAVQVVDDVDTAPVERDGPLIERHARFPNRVNAGFMQIVNRGEIRLRVFERGVGETIACGTGACAAVAAGIARGLLDAHVLVHARGGDLRIEWAGRGHPLYMTGPAMKVFDGEIELAD